ncbi:chromatin assembly factor 1 subunit p90-like [Pyrus ussuriensis x Pyrus communis]|uniref:Chromatin assembly factor 1 subunit p90-like n=1 Tax=Pyrus ussuriensis x Pyrus communis TaxID=2448454 RepID=A0A5N5GRA5_9ROSA|nr:chromatin assembly factor 1 subunit p90-like [Pyrus ussuriensis x Pyrus communis]
MTRQQMTHWRLYDSHSISKRSPWLQTTLSEAMLRLIQEEPDSFAQCAEIIVEKFYRIHRSLAERYDQVKSDSGTRLLTTIGSPFSSTKCYSEKSMSVVDLSFDSHSETFDDPEPEDEPRVDEETKENALSRVSEDEVRKLRETIARLEEDHRTQKDELQQKDEVKREVIRQLSLALRKKCFARESPNNSSPFALNKFTGTFLRNLFNRSPKSHGKIVAL